MKALIYNSIGKIVRLIDAPESMLVAQIQGLDQFLLNGEANDKLQYIVNESILDRPIQLTILDKIILTADGIDIINITNSPDGIFIAVNMVTKDTISGEISGSDTFSTTIPGTYKIKIESFPYLDFEATIEAT